MIENKDSQELFSEFEKLSLDEKRNFANSEFITLCQVVKTYLAHFGQEVNTKNYDYILGTDITKSEDEILNIYFKELMELRENLLMLLMYFDNNNKN